MQGQAAQQQAQGTKMKIKEIKSLVEKIRDSSLKSYLKAEGFLATNPKLSLCLLGLFLVYQGTENSAFAQATAGGGNITSGFGSGGSNKYGIVCNNALAMAEGQFGAMVTAIAGVGAILAAAMGSFRGAWSCAIVSGGAFVLRAYVSLFFSECTGGGGAGN
jgi:hypothetical protein